ncbi:ATP-binding protein [Caenimonas koreensis]|uniref:ATP-binding protein n=1 Tax=Caenimonas koreensis TaxID=367474 RepID=UPI0037833336
MNHSILTTRITAQTLVPLRTRARQVGELFGLDQMQRTRFVTALSEIARNAVQYAGEGLVTFILDAGDDDASPQRLIGCVSDRGPGIDDLDGVMKGRLNAQLQVPLGIVGSRRLVDSLEFASPPGGGTVVTLAIALSRGAPRLAAPDVGALVDQLARRKPQSPLEELEQQNREMLEALQELRSKQLELKLADQRKNQFLATLAHELRNPLGTLHMTIEIMRRHEHMPPAQLVERREVMARQVQQLSRLVDDLMDVSRISLGKVALQRQFADVNDLAREALEMTQAAIQAKRHAVSFQPAPQALMVDVDVARMKQVLGNLIHNAARYTTAGGRIGVSVRREDAYAIVDVADNGMGISPQEISNVFGLFVQGNSGDGQPAGLGVGLTLVQRLVEAHGGHVRAASAGVGQGSRFTVSLPLHRVTPDSRPAP